MVNKLSYLLLTIIGIFISCANQKLLLKKSEIPDVIKTNGFYYVKTNEYSKTLKDSVTNYNFTFYYIDGTFLKHFTSPSLEKEILDFNIKNQYEILKKDQTNWGLYEIYGSNIIREGWNTSVGGGLPRSRAEGYVKNDSTIVFTKSFAFDNKCCPKINSNYEVENHFFPYSPKPDSSNIFLNEY
jgi:hypothetical protein